jgi:hypothetical protein
MSFQDFKNFEETQNNIDWLSRLELLTATLQTLPPHLNVERAYLLLEMGQAELELAHPESAWDSAESALILFLKVEDWEGAVQACDVLYNTHLENALIALANGIWLGVTFPIDPEITAVLLEHLVDETIQNADGAAVAAATACYIIDLRAPEKKHQSLRFFADQLLGRVATRHSQIDNQTAFQAWVQRLELNDPSKFLPRLAQVLEVISQNKWWFDRDELRSRLP